MTTESIERLVILKQFPKQMRLWTRGLHIPDTKITTLCGYLCVFILYNRMQDALHAEAVNKCCPLIADKTGIH